jgi:cytochrome c55X
MLARGVAIIGLMLLCATVLADIANPRRRELVSLVRQDCGACHGMTLKGGLGPPLTSAALSGKSSEYLRAVILDGRAGTPMPPWRPFLSDAEVTWLVHALKEGSLDAR